MTHPALQFFCPIKYSVEWDELLDMSFFQRQMSTQERKLHSSRDFPGSCNDENNSYNVQNCLDTFWSNISGTCSSVWTWGEVTSYCTTTENQIDAICLNIFCNNDFVLKLVLRKALAAQITLGLTFWMQWHSFICKCGISVQMLFGPTVSFYILMDVQRAEQMPSVKAP